jgi:hypothetical protein
MSREALQSLSYIQTEVDSFSALPLLRLSTVD